VGCWPNANAANSSRPRAFFLSLFPGYFLDEPAWGRMGLAWGSWGWHGVSTWAMGSGVAWGWHGAAWGWHGVAWGWHGPHGAACGYLQGSCRPYSPASARKDQINRMIDFERVVLVKHATAAQRDLWLVIVQGLGYAAMCYRTPDIVRRCP
jgi:hypothetical protein